MLFISLVVSQVLGMIWLLPLRLVMSNINHFFYFKQYMLVWPLNLF